MGLATIRFAPVCCLALIAAWYPSVGRYSTA